MPTTLNVNGQDRIVQSPPDTPLLWVLRDELGLTGTKYGCGIAQCGACTVHLDGQPQRACQAPVGSLAGVKLDVPQCGYCQSGQLMSAAALLAKTPKPDDSDIDLAMRGNICRCGTYQRIRAAIKDAAGVEA